MVELSEGEPDSKADGKDGEYGNYKGLREDKLGKVFGEDGGENCADDAGVRNIGDDAERSNITIFSEEHFVDLA